MFGKFVLTLLMLILSVSLSLSAQENSETLVIYKGVQMREADLLRNRTSAIYCSLVIDEWVVKRGYWDGRYDKWACFDTHAEAVEFSNSNPPAPVTKSNHATMGFSLLQSACANQDRGTGFGGPLYGGAYPDVCANRTETYIGGMDGIDSVWLENPVADSICPAILIRENYYPPRIRLVDYSAAFTNFIYVAWYRWSPKSC